MRLLGSNDNFTINAPAESEYCNNLKETVKAWQQIDSTPTPRYMEVTRIADLLIALATMPAGMAMTKYKSFISDRVSQLEINIDDVECNDFGNLQTDRHDLKVQTLAKSVEAMSAVVRVAGKGGRKNARTVKKNLEDLQVRLVQGLEPYTYYEMRSPDYSAKVHWDTHDFLARGKPHELDHVPFFGPRPTEPLRGIKFPK